MSASLGVNSPSSKSSKNKYLAQDQASTLWDSFLSREFFHCNASEDLASASGAFCRKSLTVWWRRYILSSIMVTRSPQSSRKTVSNDAFGVSSISSRPNGEKLVRGSRSQPARRLDLGITFPLRRPEYNEKKILIAINETANLYKGCITRLLFWK